MGSYIEKADHFTDHEKQFHLGFLPSEAVNPLTAHLSDDFARSPDDGVAALDFRRRKNTPISAPRPPPRKVPQPERRRIPLPPVI